MHRLYGLTPDPEQYLHCLQNGGMGGQCGNAVDKSLSCVPFYVCRANSLPCCQEGVK